MFKRTVQTNTIFTVFCAVSLFVLLLARSKSVIAESSTNLNIGSVSGSILYDTPNFGTQQFPDRPVHCKTVTLTPEPSVDAGAGNGMPISMVTDVSGQFAFSNLPADNNLYTLSIDNLDNSEIEVYPVADPDSTADLQVDLTLNASRPLATDQDFLVDYLLFSVLNGVSGELFGDNDGDGTGSITADDIPLAGVVVSLSIPDNLDLGNGVGQPVTTTTTSDGYYLFDNLVQSVVNSCYPQSLIYTVSVDTTTLPAPYDGIPNYDPDDVFDAQSVVNLNTNSFEELNFSFLPITVTALEMLGFSSSVQTTSFAAIISMVVSGTLVLISYHLLRKRST